MNIILIGYRGTGKSVVAEALTDRLGMAAVSMDAAIVHQAGMSIPDFVEQHGWDGFRDLETIVARELAQRDNIIVDTGGGVIERQENIDCLKGSGLIFWLKASVDVIVQRIESGTQRPALIAGKTFTEEVAEVLARRTAKYRAACRYEIDTDTISPDQVAAEITAIWRQQAS